MTATTDHSPLPQLATPPKVRLGEELPIFCEQCGYILHGLPMVRCEHCSILQFQCPECGHHQAINTLRPAFQRILGRARATWLALVVLFKLNYFGWLMFAWFMGGYSWCYTYRYQQIGGNWSWSSGPYSFRMADAIGMAILGLLFGMVGRMLLLRWRSGWWVGAVLGLLVVAAMLGGAEFRSRAREMSMSPFGADFIQLTLYSGVGVALGAGVVWWIWSALAYVFLPRPIAGALLDWQRSLSTPRVSGLARE